MRLWIFSTKKDLSLERIITEATKLAVSHSVVYFETLNVQKTTLHTGKKKLVIPKGDRIIIRWPFDADNTDREYNVFVRYLLEYYGSQVVFDTDCLREFSPFYEDKLFQSFVFEILSIRTPRTWSFQTIDQLSLTALPFPCVLKKRISSRSKNNFVVMNVSDLKKKLSGKQIQDYLLQEYIEIEHDVRVLILKSSVLGSVKRETHVRAGNRLTVKGREVFSSIPKNVISSAKKVQRYLGADFVGFDVLFATNGEVYFIEANLSPQFDKFEEATGVNAAKKLIQEAC